jgi:hypothetical protein
MLNSMDKRQCCRSVEISQKLYFHNALSTAKHRMTVTYEMESRWMKTDVAYLILHLFSEAFQLFRLRMIER